ncbi:patatin-like phospholipase family protein [Halopseudomonas bauzanensis]|uniref:NTE family protein n=1 Tax=Halopseudomonas bauzanensis TaxID=653930 RepID=A0A1H9VEK4_9GAMM|nr:patatin-like phospholipase family protein [Halopseudomonas bauzanensis]SES19981.1 NTE family protein [Halopseudomonas bauzanensis]SFM16001.1 NTE family protein [Halopseudomonas bauzanensis]
MFRPVILLLLVLLPALAVAQNNPPSTEIRTGLVLSGGGARGLAHIGVLKQIEEQNIPIHAIAGTSMGAVIGGLYAAGYSADELEQIALEMDWPAALSDSPLREDIPYRRKQDDRDFLVKQRLTFKGGKLSFPLGLLQGQNLGLVLESLLVHTNDIDDFDRLPIPFRAVATDIATGDAVVFKSGHLPQAIRASIGLPGFFAPVMVDGRMLVDGVLSKNLPVDVAREMGVDRVIVVDIATPLKPAEDMHTILDIMDQTTTLLTRNNTQEQLATLTEQDLLLQPELGSIAFSSFAEADEAIDAGAQSLLQSPHLQAFAHPANVQQPGGNLASNRPHRQPIIHEIRVVNSGKVADEVVRSMVRQQLGEPLNTDHLAKDMGTIYGTDYFSQVNYEILHEGDRNTLLIRTSGRETGTDYLRLGLNLVDDFEGGSQFTMGASFRVNGVNPLGAEWLTRLQLGEHQQLYSEFYQPLDYGSRYFIAPFIDAEARNVEVILDNDPVADYRQQRYGAGINFGRQIANNGEVRFGLSRYWGESEIRVGDPEQPTLEFDEAFYSLQVDRDTLDNVNFPRSGDAARILWRQSEPDLGADERYQQLEVRANKAFASGPHSLQLGASLGRTDSDVDVAQSSFLLGGIGKFSGFRQNGLAGQNYNLARVVYYRQLNPGSTPLTMPFYLGGSLEYGRVYNKGEEALDTGYMGAGSLLLGMDTFLGPLFFGIGANQEGERALYMNLGQTF